MLTPIERRILMQVRDYLVTELEEIDKQKQYYARGKYGTFPLKAIYSPGLKRAIDDIETQFLNKD